MKWIAISGSWRKVNEQLEKDVRREVQAIIFRGEGIVTGGALGVDYLATDEALRHESSAQRIRIFLPTPLEIYTLYYLKSAEKGFITEEQAKKLIGQLAKIKALNPSALTEDRSKNVVDEETYYKRDTEIIKVADELIAFHVNKSKGTQDTIDKAHEKGIPVKIFSYSIA